MKNDDDNFSKNVQRRGRRKTSPKKLQNPIYSPDTLDALSKAEKLIQEAQKKILEVSYDVTSSPECEPSIGSNENEDDSYIREIVASRFYEANESGRIFTRSKTRRPIERFHRPEVLHGCSERTKKYHEKNRTETFINRHAKTRNGGNIGLEKLSGNLIKSSPESQNKIQEPASQISLETPKLGNEEKILDSKTSSTFNIQNGPHLDIRGECTITRIEEIDISPDPASSFPVQENSKTFEFHHESQEIAEKKNSEIISHDLTFEAPEVEGDSSVREIQNLTLTPRGGSRHEHDENNKSGRSIQPESLEGHDNTRITNVETSNDKRDGESFMDFLQRAGNDENKYENNRDNVSFDSHETRNIFDNAVQQFFNETKLPSHIVPQQEPEVNEFCDEIVESDDSLENSFLHDSEYIEDHWNANDIDLEPPNIGELTKALKKLDSTMEKVLRGTENLGLLFSEHSNEPEVESNRYTIDSEEFNDIPTRDSDPEIPMKNREKHENDNIKDFIDTDESTTSGIYHESTLVGTSQDLKKIVGKKNVAHPRFSTPYDVLKIGKNYQNFGKSSNSQEFAGFSMGIKRPKNNGEALQGTSKDESPKIHNEDDIINREEVIVTDETRKNVPVEKKNILCEIEKKCNFEALFNRESSNKTGNDEIQENATFSAHSNHDKPQSLDLRNSTTRSLIPDSVIHETIENDEKSIGTNLCDEYATKKDSSKSERSAASINTEISKSKKANSHESVEKVTSHEKTFSLEQRNTNAEDLLPHPEETLKNHSAKKEEEKNNEKTSTESSRSSLKDRTSFDVSTAYSEDFEEPTESTEKSKVRDKVETANNSTVKSVSIEQKVQNEAETPIKKNEEDPPESLSQDKNEDNRSKEEDYLKKSISVSELKSNERKADENCREVTNNSPILVQEEKVSAEIIFEKKEEYINEILEKSHKDPESSDSSTKSSKVSRTNSAVEESRRDELKAAETCSENYSEGELYLPSSCSYSLGEIRISELVTFPTSGFAGVETSSRNTDGARIFLPKSFINLNSSDNTMNPLDSPVQSLGEVQETEVESTENSQGSLSDGQHQQGFER